MGEYYKDLKIGCCERIYQLRHDEVERNKHKINGDNLPLSSYLQEGMWFRFPFPEEDDTDWETEREMDKCIEFTVPDEIDISDIEHRTMTFSTSQLRNKRNITGNVNIFIPCIYSKDFNLKSSPIPTKQKLLIYMKIIRGGKLQTVFMCPYCEATFRMSDEDINIIKKSFYAMKSDYWNKIADRL